MEHKLSDADSRVGLVHQYIPSPPQNPTPFYRGATGVPQLEDDKKGEGKNLGQANSYVHILAESPLHTRSLAGPSAILQGGYRRDIHIESSIPH